MGPRAGLDRYGKSRLYRDSITGRPACSESLYRKRHPGRRYTYKLCVNRMCKVTVTNVAMVGIFGFILYPKSLTSYSIHNLYLSNNFSHKYDMI